MNNLSKLVLLFAVISNYSFGQAISVEPNRLRFNPFTFFQIFNQSEPSLQLVSTHPTYAPSISFRHIGSNNSYTGKIGGDHYGNLELSNNQEIRFSTFYNNNELITLRILNDGRIGVGKVPSPFAKFDVDGNIRSSSLDFTEQSSSERRPVLVDKDGVLRTSNSSNYYQSYSFNSVLSAGFSDYQDAFINRSAGFASFYGAANNLPRTMYIPVNLPDGVKVTNVKGYVVDDSNSNLEFVFAKISHSANTVTTITTQTSNGANANIIVLNSDCNETINNQANSYYIRISSVGDWIQDNMKFRSAVITYQYQ